MNGYGVKGIERNGGPEDVVAALEYAARCHDGQMRKSGRTPYIAHPAAAAVLVANAGGSVDAQVAAALHDVVEDTDATLTEVEERFGSAVAHIVDAVGEPDKSRPWGERKAHTLAGLKDLPDEAALVLLADKLANVDALGREIAQEGRATVFARMREGPRAQAWYYGSIARTLGQRDALGRRYARKVTSVFGDDAVEGA